MRARGIYPEGACIKKQALDKGGKPKQNKGVTRLSCTRSEGGISSPPERREELACNTRFYEVTDEEVVTQNGILV